VVVASLQRALGGVGALTISENKKLQRGHQVMLRTIRGGPGVRGRHCFQKAVSLA